VKNIVRIFVFALLLVAAFSFAVVKGESNYAVAQAAPGEVEVKIDDFSFGRRPSRYRPAQKLPVKIVTTFRTRWSARKEFSSLLSWIPNETFSFTFDKPGTYIYFCSIHPKMTGPGVVT